MMNVQELALENVGQIRKAEVRFGDLTVLVGPQAAGKTILLEWLKLLMDAQIVGERLRLYGREWGRRADKFLELFFGEGMHSLWRPGESAVVVNGCSVDAETWLRPQASGANELVSYIPAQRVLTLGRGWPRPFSDYSPGDPFVVPNFSEWLRGILEAGFASGETIFPRLHRFSPEARMKVFLDVFSEWGLQVNVQAGQKRLVLAPGQGGNVLPFMVWSAGQREIVPLILSLDWLLSPEFPLRQNGFEWVVIEEPEMGLHPRAIEGVMLMVLELVARGYKVCVSTHSPQLLDVIWVIRHVSQHGADPVRLLDLFNLDDFPKRRNVMELVLKKLAKVYFFDRESGCTRDISDLDPGAEDSTEAGWGGLTAFSGRASEVVSKVMSAVPD